MKKIGILYHPMKKPALTLAKELGDFLTSKGLSVWLHSAWEWDKIKKRDTDLMLSVGGDGTILRTAQVALGNSAPIVGINLGKLGFMTELSVDEAKSKLTALLKGEGWIDERSLLEARLSGEGQKPDSFYALNDVVVARGAIVRVIDIEVTIDGEHLTTYRADGAIVATATGSTGYALAAGGPILHPKVKEFMLVPILSHPEPAHPLVLPAKSVVQLSVNPLYPATLSIDGHVNLPLSCSAAVTVKQSARTIKFLRIHPESYFYSSLERKLKGKQ